MSKKHGAQCCYCEHAEPLGLDLARANCPEAREASRQEGAPTAVVIVELFGDASGCDHFDPNAEWYARDADSLIWEDGVDEAYAHRKDAA